MRWSLKVGFLFMDYLIFIDHGGSHKESSPWVTVKVTVGKAAFTQRTEGTVFPSELWDVSSPSHVSAQEETSEQRINMLIIEESKYEPRDRDKVMMPPAQNNSGHSGWARLWVLSVSVLVADLTVSCSCCSDCNCLCLPARAAAPRLLVWETIQPNQIHDRSSAVSVYLVLTDVLGLTFSPRHTLTHNPSMPFCQVKNSLAQMLHQVQYLLTFRRDSKKQFRSHKPVASISGFRYILTTVIESPTWQFAALKLTEDS